MNRIEKLIKELCPNGVKFEKLSNVLYNKNGYTPSKNNQDFWTNGDVPWFRLEDIRKNGVVLSDALQHVTKEAIRGNLFPANSIIMSTTATIGEHALITVESIGNQQLTYFWLKDEFKDKINIKFMFYYFYVLDGFCKNNLRGNALPIADLERLKEQLVPVPPVEVQCEIVHILDNFTLLTAELTARKKQYEYYRDSLLTFDLDIPRVKLGDIATDIYRGSGITREMVTKTGTPCVRYGEIYTKYNLWFDNCLSHTKLENVVSPKYFEYGDILFAITGESIEDIAKSVAYVGNEKCLAGGDIVVLKHNQNPKYLSLVLSTNDAIKQKGKGKVKSKVVHSSVPAISEIEIPLPSLEIQEKLVNVLENFESLCNDLGIGLPAEIEARMQQYEFYRTKLLTMLSEGVNLSKQASKQAS